MSIEQKPKTIEDALAIALKAHGGQKDLAGKPYILHVMHVMLAVATEEERIVAALHDVVEDSHYTLFDLLQLGFSVQVVDAVNALTRDAGEPYEVFIQRCKQNPLARAVKQRDLEHNMDFSRIPDPQPEDYARAQKYSAAYREILC